MTGALMVCGTASDVGKSHVVTGLCRLLRRKGVKVAPFKAQNMALNSFVTRAGHEIGRAQAAQAFAAGVEPEIAMNPVLLKPTGERTSQVVVMGRPIGHFDAAGYQTEKRRLGPIVERALSDLRARFDVVILEGAGGAAEINLLDDDIVNLRLADRAGVPAIIVADIDRGGAFAALFGTVGLLPPELRRLVKGFVINKFRGDPTLLDDGLLDLERRAGVPTLGVLPYLHDVALDAEDSLSLTGHRPRPEHGHVGDPLDVAVVRFPRIANFTDFDPLGIEPGVTVRLIDEPGALGNPDLIILPGTKATVSDLGWMRGRGFDRAIAGARRNGSVILGICGGYQMMGQSIADDIESDAAKVEALGWLDVHTVFEWDKVTRQRRGTYAGRRLTGYEIHHGHVHGGMAWIALDDVYGTEGEGATANDGQILGTVLHGLFEEDGFRAAFLADVGRRRRKTFVPAHVSFAAARGTQIDRLADMIDAHLDVTTVEALIKAGTAA
ncbi:MAG TPA: cobyric acid synthase [Acidimicrobiales bacterium]|nr:cobyric acid synthase [Acidimicrobiales bacterium]